MTRYVFPADHCTAQAVDTNWRTADSGWHSFDLETYPLDVLTTGDSGRINIVMYREDETDVYAYIKSLGNVKLTLEPGKPVVAYVYDGAEFSVELPDGNTTRVWRIARTSAGFVITCNGVELINYTHPEAYAEQWSGHKVGQIIFWRKDEETSYSDSLSQKFRGKIYKVEFENLSKTFDLNPSIISVGYGCSTITDSAGLKQPIPQSDLYPPQTAIPCYNMASLLPLYCLPNFTWSTHDCSSMIGEF